MASFSATTSTGGTPVSSVRKASFAPAGFLIKRTTIVFDPAGMRSNRPKAALKSASPREIATGLTSSATATAAAATAL